MAVVLPHVQEGNCRARARARGAVTSRRRLWNANVGADPVDSCGAYMAATLDVTTLSYLPYAVFNFASPLLTIAIAYAGVRMLRGEATQEQARRG